MAESEYRLATDEDWISALGWILTDVRRALSDLRDGKIVSAYEHLKKVDTDGFALRDALRDAAKEARRKERD